MSFLFFLASGGLSTLLDLALFGLLVQFCDSSIAYLLSYTCCVVARYYFDTKYTFTVDKPALRHFGWYFLANACLMIMGLLIFHLMSLYFSPLVSKIISIPPVTLTGFLVMNFLVFPANEASGE